MKASPSMSRWPRPTAPGCSRDRGCTDRLSRTERHAMSEAVVDGIVAVLPPLLQSLEALSFIARHLNPPDFGRVMEAAGTPDETLRSVRTQLAEWPAEFA